jgi:hypothetical protein
VLVFFGFLLIPSGCTQSEICLSNQHAVQTGFYSAWAVSDKDSSLTNSSVYGVEMEASPIYFEQDIQKMFLPVSFNSDTTGFVIDNNTLRDTIWFRHTKELKYISRECGFTFNFVIDSVWHTNTFIDSVSVFYPSVNYGENFENVKIYLY